MRSEAPSKKGGLRGKAPHPPFKIGTFWLNVSPHGPGEVRMGNLGVRSG